MKEIIFLIYFLSLLVYEKFTGSFMFLLLLLVSCYFNWLDLNIFYLLGTSFPILDAFIYLFCLIIIGIVSKYI